MLSRIGPSIISTVLLATQGSDIVYGQSFHTPADFANGSVAASSSDYIIIGNKRFLASECVYDAPRAECPTYPGPCVWEKGHCIPATTPPATDGDTTSSFTTDVVDPLAADVDDPVGPEDFCVCTCAPTSKVNLFFEIS